MDESERVWMAWISRWAITGPSPFIPSGAVSGSPPLSLPTRSGQSPSFRRQIPNPISNTSPSPFLFGGGGFASVRFLLLSTVPITLLSCSFFSNIFWFERSGDKINEKSNFDLVKSNRRDWSLFSLNGEGFIDLLINLGFGNFFFVMSWCDVFLFLFVFSCFDLLYLRLRSDFFLLFEDWIVGKLQGFWWLTRYSLVWVRMKIVLMLVMGC